MAATLATQSYDALLARRPEAFADHASEFFRGPGLRPGRALLLAENNLKLRQTPRAYLLALQAGEDAGSRDLLCRILPRARELVSRHHGLKEIVSRIESLCRAGR